MPLVKQTTAPSTVADVLQQVKDAFQDMGNPTPILIGKNYISRGPGGTDARVIIVPYTGGKADTGMIEMGSAGSFSATCEVHVRAKDAADDVERLRQCEALAKLVWDVIRTAAPGRIEGGNLEDISITDVDGNGFELSFSFTYRHDVWHEADRWKLDPVGPDTGAEQPIVPPGGPGTVDTVTFTAAPPAP